MHNNITQTERAHIPSQRISSRDSQSKDKRASLAYSLGLKLLETATIFKAGASDYTNFAVINLLED